MLNNVAYSIAQDNSYQLKNARITGFRIQATNEVRKRSFQPEHSPPLSQD